MVSNILELNRRFFHLLELCTLLEVPKESFREFRGVLETSGCFGESKGVFESQRESKRVLGSQGQFCSPREFWTVEGSFREF